MEKKIGFVFLMVIFLTYLYLLLTNQLDLPFLFLKSVFSKYSPKKVTVSSQSQNKNKAIEANLKEGRVVGATIKGGLKDRPSSCGNDLCVVVELEEEKKDLTFNLGPKERLIAYQFNPKPEVRAGRLSDLLPEFRVKRLVGLVVDLENQVDYSGCLEAEWCTVLDKEYKKGLEVNKKFWDMADNLKEQKWIETLGPVTKVEFY